MKSSRHSSMVSTRGGLLPGRSRVQIPAKAENLLISDLKGNYIKEQLKMILQNVNEVNRERICIAAASRVHDSTRQNGLIIKSALMYG